MFSPSQHIIRAIKSFRGGTRLMARVTIEDCIEKVPSRFTLVHLAAQRSKQLIRGARPLVESGNKPVVQALREIAAGLVTLADKQKESNEDSDTLEA